MGEDPSAAAVAPPTAAQADAAVLESEERWARELAALRGSRSQFAKVLDVWDCVLAAEAGWQLPAGLAGYLRASLRVPHWRDAVLVMSAAGRQAADQGAEDFGILQPHGDLPVVTPPLGGLPAAAPAEDAAYPVPGYGDVLLGLAPASPAGTGCGHWRSSCGSSVRPAGAKAVRPP